MELSDGSYTRTLGAIDTIPKVGSVSSRERIYVMENPTDTKSPVDDIIILDGSWRRRRPTMDWETDNIKIVRKDGSTATICRKGKWTSTSTQIELKKISFRKMVSCVRKVK